MPILGLAFFVMLVFIAVMVSVGGWMVISIIRGISRLIFGDPARPAARPMNVAAGTCHCPRADCHADNPAHAQFCRRCGEPLRGMAGYRAQRVA